MSTAAPVYEERRVSIGRVFQRAFSAIAFNPAVMLGLALVVGALPGLLMTWVFFQIGLTSPEALRNGSASFGSFFGAILISSLISMIISALVQAALTRATVAANEGRRVTFGESLSSALSVVAPLIGLSILFAFGVAIGFMLLLVPGLILLTMWAVAVPALVIERDGVFQAFNRSGELTKGSRWKILGLFLVLVVGYWLLSMVFGLVGLATFNAATATSGITATNIIGSIVLGTLFNMVWGTVQPSLYVELRQAREGDSADRLAEVFG